MADEHGIEARLISKTSVVFLILIYHDQRPFPFMATICEIADEGVPHPRREEESQQHEDAGDHREHGGHCALLSVESNDQACQAKEMNRC